MIQMFTSQVNNFANNQTQVNVRNNKTNSKSNFNDILDNQSKAQNNRNKLENKPKDNSDFIKSQSAANNNRRVDIKSEQTKPTDQKSDKNNSKTEGKATEVLSKGDKTVEELIENLANLLAVFQNVIEINLNDLEGINPEEVNLEISLEELEGLKLSLEDIVSTLDLGDSEQVINNTIANLGEMIEDVVTKGEIEVPAEEFITELKQVMDIVNSQSAQSTDQSLSNDTEKLSTELQKLVSTIDNSKEVKENKKVEHLDVKTESKETKEVKTNKVYDNSKDIKEEMPIIDSEVDEAYEGIKIKIVTEKKEGINLFRKFGDIEDIALTVKDEVIQNVEPMPIDVLSTQSQTRPQSTSKIENNTIINSEQYLELDKTDILKQITNRVRTDRENEMNEIRIKLNPEHLGELTIKVSLERGIISARAFVNNSDIKQLLESNIGELKDSLKEQGIEFNSIDVSVGEDPDFEDKSPNFFRSEQRMKNLKVNVENPNDMNYYEELSDNNESSELSVGESSMDITI